MALSSLFDDFPIFNYDNGGSQRRRRPRPLLYSVLDSLEDQIGQRVGQVFRLLPALTLDLEDQYENAGPGKKRKLRPGAVSTYEPKSKVAVTNKDKFKITLDTSNYQPEEITVKVVDDKIAISAKHEAKEKDVYEFCEMYRSFDIPENVDPNAITSHLSTSGQLTIEAPLKAVKETTERTIPVEIEGKEKHAVEEAAKSPAKENKTNCPKENVSGCATEKESESATEKESESATEKESESATEKESSATEKESESATEKDSESAKEKDSEPAKEKDSEPAKEDDTE